MMLPLDFFYRSGRSLISALVHVSPLGALGSVLLIVRRLACGVGAGVVLCALGSWDAGGRRRRGA